MERLSLSVKFISVASAPDGNVNAIAAIKLMQQVSILKQEIRNHAAATMPKGCVLTEKQNRVSMLFGKGCDEDVRNHKPWSLKTTEAAESQSVNDGKGLKTFLLTWVNQKKVLLLSALTMMGTMNHQIVNGLHTQTNLIIEETIGLLMLMGNAKLYLSGVRN